MFIKHTLNQFLYSYPLKNAFIAGALAGTLFIKGI